MAIDTLAYSKALEAAGIDRRAAEAHAEGLTKFVLPDIATKADLQVVKSDLEHALERIEHRLTIRVLGIVLRIVDIMNSILFALLRH